MHRSAVIDSTGTWRYSLTRVWGRGSLPPCIFIMFNPSTADGLQDDPTIRRCISFAERLDCSSLEVVNLFALRATNPKEVWTWRKGNFDPVGPANNFHICEAAKTGLYTIAAWGRWPSAIVKNRVKNVKQMLNALDISLHCLGTTKDGSPRHPLYLKQDTPLIEYEEAKHG